MYMCTPSRRGVNPRVSVNAFEDVLLRCATRLNILIRNRKRHTSNRLNKVVCVVAGAVVR